MNNIKILCLGNEFIKEDSLAKKISNELINDFPNLEFINITDSFQLMGYISDNIDLIILDVVLGLKKVSLLSVDDLKSVGIMTAHDFDAGFVFKLLGKEKKIKIIGIPMNGNISKIKEDVKKYLATTI